nr:MAG TPA: hypothetical protein [Bacteriophage sp.]DAV71215.1 MAG TPA: hypothetical protein [Bacteriophage sp.]
MILDLGIQNMCAFKLLFILFSISYKIINILKQITLRFTNSKHFVLRIIDAVLAVSAIIEIADIFYRLVKIVLKLVVGHVKLHLAAFLPCFKTLEAMLLHHLLQFIQQEESETIHHPGLERHARLPVLQRLEAVFAEIEIVFVSQ